MAKVKPNQIYQRQEDMSPDGTLEALIQKDGDVILVVTPEGRGTYAQIEFCTPFAGGGKSPKTWDALKALVQAMAEDCEKDGQAPATQAPERPKTGLDLVAAERARQIAQEGWTPEHDDNHYYGELARAAVSYLKYEIHWALHENFKGASRAAMRAWPWERDFFKPTPGDPIRTLVKAAALAIAEIDRLQRLAKNFSSCESCNAINWNDDAWWCDEDGVQLCPKCAPPSETKTHAKDGEAAANG